MADRPQTAEEYARLAAETARAMRLLDPTIAYTTADLGPEADADAQGVPLATGYRIVDTMPFGLKRLRSYLREHDVGRLTIKKRGTAVTPEQLRGQLGLKGSAEATIVLTRVAGAQHVLVVEPLDRPATNPTAPERPTPPQPAGEME